MTGVVFGWMRTGIDFIKGFTKLNFCQRFSSSKKL